MSDFWTGLTPPYRTIVADPPWPIASRMGSGGRRARSTAIGYSLMTIDQITELPVADLAMDNSHLFLWVTSKLNREGIGVMVAEAWGFRTVSELVWEKPNLGMGAFPRICHEILLVASRGSAPWTCPADVRSVQRWSQVYGTNGGKTHSAKPAGAYDLIETASEGPYVELFARAPRLGWDAWGKGYETAPEPRPTAQVATGGVL